MNFLESERIKALKEIFSLKEDNEKLEARRRFTEILDEINYEKKELKKVKYNKLKHNL